MRCIACPPRHATYDFPFGDLENGTSTDGICERCPNGKLPNTDQSVCLDCPAGLYDNQVTDRCNECPEGQFSEPGASSATGTSEGACKCSPGFFTSTSVRIRCYLNDNAVAAEISTAQEQCDACGGLGCVSSCEGDIVTVAEGWSIHKQRARTDSLVVIAIFACKYSDACPGGPINVSSSSFEKPCSTGFTGISCDTGLEDEAGINSTGGAACNVGYGGTVCGVCAVDYKQNSDGSCTSCGESSWGLMIALGAVTIAVIFWKAKALLPFLDMFQIVADIAMITNLKQIGKIVTVVLQIIGNLGMVLNITFPVIFDGVLTSFVNFFRFDLSVAFNVGCISSSGYFSGLASSVIMVLTVVAIVFALFRYEIWSIKNHVLREDELEEQKVMLEEIYDDFDKDNKGLTKEELLACVEKLGVEATAADVGKLFEEADTDGSGVLTFNQFHEAATHTQADGSSTHPGVDLASIVEAERIVDARSAAMGRCFLLVFLRKCPASFRLCMSLHFYRLEFPNMTTFAHSLPVSDQQDLRGLHLQSARAR